MEENGNRSEEAIAALRARGVDQALRVSQLASPEQILTACHRYDRRSDIGPGVLVRWIRDQDFAGESASAQTRGAQLRARFDEYVARFPVGEVAESHAALQQRRWPAGAEGDDECSGDMIVLDAEYPVLAMECDECGFTAAVGPRELHALGDDD